MTMPSLRTRRRVLVVDDSADLAESLAAAIEMLGFSARTASDGTTAIADMGSWRPEIVFLDLTMPEMSGLDVLHKARLADWSHGMIMIAMTGWSSDEQRDTALTAGFDVFVEKPFDLDMLRTLLAPFGTHRDPS